PPTGASLAKLGQLSFNPERSEADARKSAPPLEHQVPRLPARPELRVEMVKALDLEERVQERDRAAERPLDAAPRALEPAGERGAVQRHLLHPTFAEQLHGADDHKLHQPVRRALIAAHERQGHGWSAVAGHEVDEGTNAAVRVARGDDRASLVMGTAKRVH